MGAYGSLHRLHHVIINRIPNPMQEAHEAVLLGLLEFGLLRPAPQETQEIMDR